GQGQGQAGEESGVGDPVHRVDDADAAGGLPGGARRAAGGPGFGAVAAAVLHADRDGGLYLAAGGRAPAPPARLRDRLLAAVDAEHHQHDYRAVRVGDLNACAIDGSLVRTPDTPANRQAFGSAGTDDDSAPYPQLRELRCADASTRATLAVVSGPSGAARVSTGQIRPGARL